MEYNDNLSKELKSLINELEDSKIQLKEKNEVLLQEKANYEDKLLILALRSDELLEAGTSTVLCLALLAFLILVNISAIGSVVFNLLSSFSIGQGTHLYLLSVHSDKVCPLPIWTSDYPLITIFYL